MTEFLPTSSQFEPFLPELLLIGAIAAVLLVPMLLRKQNLLAVPIAATAGLGAAWLALFVVRGWSITMPAQHFGGMLLTDPFSWSIKLLLITAAIMVMALWFADSHDKFITRDQIQDTPEFFAMLLATTLGLCLMVSTTHLLMLFVAMELSSFPVYVLTAFNKGNRRAAKATLKFALFGAAASALTLYGISVFYGLFGTLDLQQVSTLLTGQEGRGMLNGPHGIAFALGIIALLAGVGFKIAMVPIHFWCPDVFEAASIDVGTFLSVASITAGLAALLRILVTLTGTTGATGSLSWLGIGLLIVGAVTCFVGSLGACTQNNIKRLLAWSTIAHAGFMLIGMCALTLPAHHANPGAIKSPAESLTSPAGEMLLFYLVMILFMNGGAFIAAAAIAQRITGPEDAGMSLGVDKVISASPPRRKLPDETGEDIRQYTGLWRRAPILAAIMLFFLLSLTGVPLTIGFATKLKLLSTLFNVGATLGSIAVAVIIINTLILAFSYFRIVRQMYFTESDAPRLIEIAPVTVVALVLVVPNILLFVGYGLVEPQTQRHAEMLAPPPRTSPAVSQ
jgi:NADH-quinone oxidoreductase subunit N